ncbi:hypothetical protein PRO82_000207 [Candidatus Protochlamydia amoebophila]|nr:hypothetical protein [Candidatus Protochlamydia amoebophila]
MLKHLQNFFFDNPYQAKSYSHWFSSTSKTLYKANY